VSSFCNGAFKKLTFQEVGVLSKELSILRETVSRNIGLEISLRPGAGVLFFESSLAGETSEE
jgi:hypothetical protein